LMMKIAHCNSLLSVVQEVCRSFLVRITAYLKFHRRLPMRSVLNKDASVNIHGPNVTIGYFCRATDWAGPYDLASPPRTACFPLAVAADLASASGLTKMQVSIFMDQMSQ